MAEWPRARGRATAGRWRYLARRLTRSVTALAGLSCAAFAWAQSSGVSGPSGSMTASAAAPAAAVAMPQTVRIVVPFPAGGTTDILARQLATELTQRWSANVIVENRPGASGMIASEQITRAPADGSVLMLTATHHVINPSLYAKIRYDTRNDFTPIALIATVPNVLVVTPSLPVRNVQELIAYARQSPGKLRFGSTGVGGANHLSGELFRLQAGIDIVHVPYKGAAPALNDLLGGHIPMMFDSLPGVIGQLRLGKLRALAVTSARRAPAAPDIPTMEEAGIKGVESTAWFGLYAPAGMAPELLRRLHADVAAALASPRLRAQFADEGAEAGGLSQVEFARFVDAEIAKWARVIYQAKIRIE